MFHDDWLYSFWWLPFSEFHGPVRKVKTEPDMLVATAKSKDACKHYMNSAAIVVRGLPVKLVDYFLKQLVIYLGTSAKKSK